MFIGAEKPNTECQLLSWSNYAPFYSKGRFRQLLRHSYRLWRQNVPQKTRQILTAAIFVAEEGEPPNVAESDAEADASE